MLKEKGRIPSMGGHEIGNDLERWAAMAKPGTVNIELGAWLGAGTYHIAKGSRVPVHVFDRWKCRGIEPTKADKAGIKIYKDEDLLPIIKNNLKEFKNIVYHKTEINNLKKWAGPKISLYVDDACKRSPVFENTIDKFIESWIPGETIIVLMDYYWHLRHGTEPNAQAQPRWYSENKHRLEKIKEWPGTCPVAFRWHG